MAIGNITKQELIDTLWNVNICADNASKKSNGN